MRSFQTTITLEVYSSFDDDFFSRSFDETYSQSMVNDHVVAALMRKVDNARVDTPQITEVRWATYDTGEVPNEIRRRRSLFFTFVRNCFSASNMWNNHGRTVWVTPYVKDDDVDFIKRNRNMIVETVSNGMDNTVGFRFPEIDEARAQEIWHVVTNRVTEQAENMWHVEYKKAVMESFDGDYEDGLIENMRQASVDNGIESIDRIIAMNPVNNRNAEPF